jgi:hypothetical protein
VLAEIVEYVAGQRDPASGGFDVALEGRTEPDDCGAEVVAPYAAAGLTWWIEAFGWWRGDWTATRDRIAAGPPRADRSSSGP